MKLPYGEWKPDVGGPNSGVASIADGVLPQASATGLGYGPAASLVTATGAEALTGAPRGMISAIKADGSYAVIAATGTTIELMDSAYQWTDIETGRTVTAGDDVSFAQFGKFVINTDTTSGMKAYDVDAGGSNSAISGAPAARQIFVANFVVFACGTSSNNRRMQSSAQGDHTNWTSAGADGVTFPDGGALVGGRDMKNGAAVVFQDSAMRLIQFGSGATLYTISKIADGRGAVSDRAIVAFDGMCFYVSTDGIWKYTVGGGNEPIGAEKVNRWLAANVPSSEYSNIVAAVDPFQKVVWFQLPGLGQLLGYDWQLNVFFTATVATTFLSRIATPGISIDSVGDAIDDTLLAIDSRVWSGGALLFGALDSAYKFATFSGASLEATLQTCVIASPQVVMVNRVTPDSDAANSQIYLGVSDNRHTAIAWKAPSGKRPSGRVPLRGKGKVYTLREVIPAGDDWTYANGMDEVETAGGGVQ